MPHGEMDGDKMSLTGADHRARAPQNLCCWRAPLAACWEERWSDGLGLALLPVLWGLLATADTAAFATSVVVTYYDSSHENLVLETVVSVDVLEMRVS